MRSISRWQYHNYPLSWRAPIWRVIWVAGTHLIIWLECILARVWIILDSKDWCWTTKTLAYLWEESNFLVSHKKICVSHFHKFKVVHTYYYSAQVDRGKIQEISCSLQTLGGCSITKQFSLTLASWSHWACLLVLRIVWDCNQISVGFL